MFELSQNPCQTQLLLERRPTTQESLFEETKPLWMVIDQNILNRMVDGLAGRFQTVIDDEEYPIEY